MKAKLKFDTAKLKEFSIAHGEKFAIVAVLALLVMFSLSAVGRETLPDKLSPKEISDKSDRVGINVVKYTDVPPEVDVVVPPNINAKVVAPVEKLVDPPFIVPVFNDPVKRADPKLYAVSELRVTPFRGAVGIAPEGAAPGLQGRPPVRPLPGLLPPSKGGGLLAPPPRGKTPTPPAKAGTPGLGGGLTAPKAGRPGTRPAPTPPPTGTHGGLLGGDAALGPRAISSNMQLPGPQSSGAAEGHHGVLVTAVVPYGLQQKEYDAKFEHARKAAEAAGPGEHTRASLPGGVDAPIYMWCKVERTDTTTGDVKLIDFGDGVQVKQDWHSADMADEKQIEFVHRLIGQEIDVSGPHIKACNTLVGEPARWSPQMPELADPLCLGPAWLTWPLPPVLLRDWGREAVHFPQIPYAPDQLDPGSPASPDDKKNDPDFGDSATAPGRVPRVPQPGMMPRHGIPGKGMGPRPGMVPGGGDAAVKTIQYQLFRFVDLDVQPRHVYQYKVQLLLRNPNFGLDPELLAKPDPNAPIYRETPWSEKSPLAMVPADEEVLAAGVHRPHRGEPRPKLDVLIWDQADALELLLEMAKDPDLGDLGMVFNFAKKTLKDIVDPVSRSVHDVTTDLRANTALLDFRGDEEKLPGTEKPAATDPSEMLLLVDVDQPEKMHLAVVNQAIDERTVDDWTATHKEPAGGAAAAAPGLGPLGPAPGGRPVIPPGRPPTSRTPPRPR